MQSRFFLLRYELNIPLIVIGDGGKYKETGEGLFKTKRD
jgi:hypothetical protein